AFPFRMTPENLVRHRLDPNIGFWRQLKEGSDRFEATGEEPLVTVRAGRYAFFPYPDPDREAEAASHRRQEDARMAALIREGHPAVRTTYVDGGQHPIFRLLARQGVDLGDISQPEAIAHAGREIPLTTGSAAAPHPGGTPGPVPQSQAYAPAAAAPPDPAAAPARLPATAVPPLRREASLALRDSLAAAEGGGWLARLTAATEAVRPEPEGPPARESFAAASRGVVGRDIVLPPGPVARGGSARDIVLPPGPVAQGGFGREILPPGPVARGGFGRNAAAAQDPASRVYSRAAAAADLPVRGGFYGVSAATAARSPARPVSRSASAAAQAPQRWWETRD
ncbi:MAG TPA: hypothetical protein VHL98_04295, partial [Microvirga sp.]|nr:hypothetical protein [Microvirga sp.]